MHSYLRAVGFSNISNRKELENLFHYILNKYEEKIKKIPYRNVEYAELSVDFGNCIGLSLRGEYDTEGMFHLDHYFPYCKGNNHSVKEEVVVNKKVDSEAITGMCDDIRLGVSLIFYVQNMLEYMKIPLKDHSSSQLLDVKLSGLSLQGSILLGVNSEKENEQKTSYETKYRNHLIAEAKKGNQEAIDSLTIDDIDLFAMVSKRAKFEDIYSIVETTFIPYGSESDNYTVIGIITDVELVLNSMTKEEIYYLTVNCNDVYFNICINKKDLLGEPIIGRRFKGNIWMQGEISL